MSIRENAANPVMIFPNPFNTRLDVKVIENKQSEIILFDIGGRKILKRKFLNSTTINTEQIADGIYIYEVRYNNGTSMKGKVIKQ